MPRREVVRSLSLPNTGLATNATKAPTPTTRDSFSGAASAPTTSSIFSARVTRRGAISIRLVLANASAYSTTNRPPTCSRGDHVAWPAFAENVPGSLIGPG